MKGDPFAVKKHTGKVDLTKPVPLGNGTIKAAKMPFPLADTTYYQVGSSGDYQQEAGG